MKRIILFSLFLFELTLCLFASPRGSSGSTRGFIIEGGVGKYNQINVNIINNTPTQKKSLDSFDEGVPFSLINNPTIAYTKITGGGRLIGTWSVATNYSNVKFNISATDLQYTLDPDQPSIGYYIVFHIVYATFDEKGVFDRDMQRDFVVKSGSDSPQTFEIDNHLGEEPFPVVSYNQDIRVYLDENVNPDSDKFPYGIYQSTVTISVSGD